MEFSRIILALEFSVDLLFLPIDLFEIWWLKYRFHFIASDFFFNLAVDPRPTITIYPAVIKPLAAVIFELIITDLEFTIFN